MVDKGVKKKRKSLAGIFFFLILTILIFNFTYASYSMVSMSPAIIIFFIIAMVWYMRTRKTSKQTGSDHLINDLGSRGEEILRKNLSTDEPLIAKLKGSFGEAFVVTERSVYIVKWGFMAGQFFGGRCNCYPYQRIVSIECKKSLNTGIVEVLTAANQNIKDMSYWGSGSRSASQSDNAVSFFTRDYDKFQEAVNKARKLMADGGRPVEHSKKDDLNQLEKLSELKDKGIITNEEFNAKKKMILGI